MQAKSVAPQQGIAGRPWIEAGQQCQTHRRDHLGGTTGLGSALVQRGEPRRDGQYNGEAAGTLVPTAIGHGWLA